MQNTSVHKPQNQSRGGNTIVIGSTTPQKNHQGKTNVGKNNILHIFHFHATAVFC